MAATVDIAAYKDILIILGTTAVAVPVLGRLGVSPVLGFLGIGTLLGPSGLGQLAAHWDLLRFVTASDSAQIAAFAELGVVFLLFLIGLELSFERLARLRTLMLGLGSAQVVASMAVIALAAGWIGLPVPAAILIAGALALSSTAIVVEHLASRRRLASSTGRTSFAVLLFQDLAVIPLLFMIGVFAARADGGSIWTGLTLAVAQGVAAIVLVVIVGRLILRPFLRMVASADEPEAFVAAAVLVAVGTGVITAAFGLSMALGAFVAGLLLAETEFRRAVEATLAPFKGILLGAFFFSVGLSIDLGIIAARPATFLALLAGLLVVKMAIVVPLVRLFGQSWTVAIRSALLLAPAGEFAFVIIKLSMAAGVVAPATGAFVITLTAVGMALVPLLDRLGERFERRLVPPAPVDPELLVPPPETAGRHVIVVGYGRVGQLVCEMLQRHAIPFIAIDRDVREIAALRRAGHEVYFGDAASPGFLENCGIRQASALVLTIHTAGAIDEIASLAKGLRPDLTIIARARDADHASQLYRLGVTDAVPETIEASLQLSEAVLLDLGVPAGLVIASVHERRDLFRQALQEAGGDPERVRKVLRSPRPAATSRA
ncbi:MAG: cation:proton antiporter [Phreatobacter sp.]